MKVYTDAARDDDITGIGWKIVLADNTVEGNRYLCGTYTSMQAEYFALLDGIRHAKRYGTDEIEVFCDCKPLVKKMRVPDTDKGWYDRRRGCLRLLNIFDAWELEWMPRAENSTADRLAFEALEEGRRA